MNAIEFAVRFQNACARFPDGARDNDLDSGRDRTEWTRLMYKVLHVAQGLDYVCRCRQQHVPRLGEHLNVDFCWFRLRPDAELEWAPIDVAIEHENSYTDFGATYDWWKVGQIAAPLRVGIFYASASAKVSARANDLVDVVKKNTWRRLPDAEDLLIVGHLGMTWDDWQMRRITGTHGETVSDLRQLVAF